MVLSFGTCMTCRYKLWPICSQAPGQIELTDSYKESTNGLQSEINYGEYNNVYFDNNLFANG